MFHPLVLQQIACLCNLPCDSLGMGFVGNLNASCTKQGAFFVVNASFLPLPQRICSLTFVFIVIFSKKRELFLEYSMLDRKGER